MKNFFLICSLIIFFNSDLKSQLIKADSLFNLNKYSESKVLYDSIFYKKNKYSNSMLLKMATIEENLGNYEKSIYYLELFQKNKNENKVLDKINNIVDNKNLNGFENSDKKIFINIYKKYRNNILALLLTLTSIIFIVNLVRYFRKNVVNFVLPFFYISSFLSLLITNLKPPSDAIVFKDYTFIMKEPSSGSDLYSILNKGDKLIVSKDLEVWYEIILNGEKRYVRKKNVRLID
ncbi:MAG: hypothetical protein CMB88_02705 [Flammeovirgaceae bacterium]|nr:hypothetical protein [Flammeovirgaceae bacterium]